MSTYAHFADRDALTKVVLEQMLADVCTRRFARTREPVGQDVVDAERSTSCYVYLGIAYPVRSKVCQAAVGGSSHGWCELLLGFAGLPGLQRLLFGVGDRRKARRSGWKKSFAPAGGRSSRSCGPTR